MEDRCEKWVWALASRKSGADKMLMRMRIDKAKHLMTSTDLTLAEIAARLGWCNAAYFTNIFRDSEGVAPKEWRRRLHPGQPIPQKTFRPFALFTKE